MSQHKEQEGSGKEDEPVKTVWDNIKEIRALNAQIQELAKKSDELAKKIYNALY